MDHEFWHERWREGRIGFHENRPNGLLEAHLSTLGLAPGSRVFLPLCGKAVDIDWLRGQGLTVLGAELSQIAVEEVFARQNLTPEITPQGGLIRYDAPALTLFVGDIFALTPEMLGPVEAVYDRAALIALPEAMRGDYSQHLLALCRAAPQLLVAFDYDQSLTAGPPFSVPEHEIRAHYAATYNIEKLASRALTGPIAQRIAGREEAWRLSPH